MAITQYNGQLNANTIYKGIFNMIISQEVFADNIADTKASLLGMFRRDGSMYGDTLLFYSTDILAVHDWGNDAEAVNLLQIERADDPECQSITINQFKQIRLSLDNYLTKQAWSTEGAFNQFNDTMEAWIADTKRVFESNLMNTFIGTNETSEGLQEVEITVPAEPASGTADSDIEAYNRIVAQTIATKMSDLVVDLEYPGRDYNDYGNMRSYNSDDLIAVWNSDFVNKIRHTDVPTIYHRDSALADKFGEYTLPGKLFGKINTEAGTAPGSNNSIRYLVEVTVPGVGNKQAKTYFPGELVPGGTAYEANTTYTVDPTIAFKLIHKRSIPFMAAFSTATEFFNPRSLTRTLYSTWGYSELEHLHNYPFITARVKPAA